MTLSSWIVYTIRAHISDFYPCKTATWSCWYEKLMSFSLMLKCSTRDFSISVCRLARHTPAVYYLLFKLCSSQVDSKNGNVFTGWLPLSFCLQEDVICIKKTEREREQQSVLVGVFIASVSLVLCVSNMHVVSGGSVWIYILLFTSLQLWSKYKTTDLSKYNNIFVIYFALSQTT